MVRDYSWYLTMLNAILVLYSALIGTIILTQLQNSSCNVSLENDYFHVPFSAQENRS